MNPSPASLAVSLLAYVQVATDDLTAKNMALVNWDGVKRRTSVNGVVFQMGARNDWGVLIDNWGTDPVRAGANLETDDALFTGKGTFGRIWLAMANAAKAVDAVQLNVASLNYGLNNGNKGFHYWGGAMDITGIFSKM